MGRVEGACFCFVVCFCFSSYKKKWDVLSKPSMKLKSPPTCLVIGFVDLCQDNAALKCMHAQKASVKLETCAPRAACKVVSWTVIVIFWVGFVDANDDDDDDDEKNKVIRKVN